MIHVYGTSHVSEQSFSVIDDALNRHEPEVVALELDEVRLNALLSEGERSGGSLFGRLIKYFQERIGSKTGVMPGEEMKYAYDKALEQGMDLALVDQDIRITLQRLKQVRRKEKVKAGISLTLGFLGVGHEFDPSKIPDKNEINTMVERFEKDFPGFYQVLMTERNQHISQTLKYLDENREGDIVAFLGAAHVNKVEELLNEEIDNQNTVERKL